MFDPVSFRTDKHNCVLWSTYEVQTLVGDLKNIRARLDLLEKNDEARSRGAPEKRKAIQDQIDKVKDLICTHDEVVHGEAWQSTCGYISIPESFVCKRCGKTLDPLKVGREELAKRVKKEG
jgi:hypothetical protein